MENSGNHGTWNMKMYWRQGEMEWGHTQKWNGDLLTKYSGTSLNGPSVDNLRQQAKVLQCSIDAEST